MEPSDENKDEALASTSTAMYVDLRFEFEDGTKFKLEYVSDTETISGLKDLIKDFTGIPDANQTLVFNGKPLEDDHATLKSEGIGINSKIRLLIEDPDSESEPAIAELFVKLPNEGDEFLSLTVNTSLTTLHLKQMLQHHMNPMAPVSKMAVCYHNNKTELQNAKRLRDYALSTGSKLDVFVKPLPENRLNIRVITPCQKRLYLQVDRTHNVQVLRDELERIKTWKKFELPPEYYFVNEGEILVEHVSFMESLILPFDEIYIVKGVPL